RDERLPSELGSNWLRAARELGIRVTAPFMLHLEDGRLMEWDALIHDFGACNGMLVFEVWDQKKADAAMRQGYGHSCMSSGRFDRDSTVDVLRDWGWCGDLAEVPRWLSQRNTDGV